MTPIFAVVLVVVAAVLFVAGYKWRALIHNDLMELKADVAGKVAELEVKAASVESIAKADIQTWIDEIKTLI